jgi:Flp pilus assembly protein CpaB
MRAAVIGLAVAGVASFLVWSYMKRFEEEASGGPRIMVLTVTKTLEPGSVIKDSDIGERGIPVAYVESRAIRAGDRQRIANLRISSALEAQQILTWSDIVATNDDRLLTNVIQPGMRAVAIHTDGTSSSLAHAGDRVDVISTVPQPGKQDHRVAVTILQNILVLGHPRGGTGTVNADGSDTFLSLAPDQAQLLAVAGDKAKLSLTLRSAIDNRPLDNLAQTSSEKLADTPAPPKVQAKPTGPAPVK